MSDAEPAIPEPLVAAPEPLVAEPLVAAPEPAIPEPLVAAPEPAVAVVPPAVSPGALAVPVTDCYTLDSFVISGVDVVPSTSAQIYVLITASTGRVFARTVKLEGDAYTAWQSDSYLYEYVATYIADNFKP